MNESLLQSIFSRDRAELYDQQFAALHALKDLIHLVLRVRFAALPRDAKILVVGAGTGAEARFLAPLFPDWRFTLVDPADGMLAVARRHAQNEGFAERCVFHAGYLPSLPTQDPFDAATSVLVSHFLADAQERRAYFESIASRLRPGGLFFNADLCADQQASHFEAAMDLWLQCIEHSRDPEAKDSFLPTDGDAPDAGHAASASYRAMFGREFAVHGPAEVEAMIGGAGFDTVVPCYQAVLVRGWLAQRSRTPVR